MFFSSAPNYLLTKLKSVDCKAYKLALGVPVRASCTGTYREVGLLPLDEFRQLASAKYILQYLKMHLNEIGHVQLHVFGVQDAFNVVPSICQLHSVFSEEG